HSFYEWSVDHRDLHSFPTRRSSDLGDIRKKDKSILTMHRRRVSLHREISRKTIFITSPNGLTTFPCNDIMSLPDELFKPYDDMRSEEHTSELQSRENLVCRLLLEKK